MVTIQRQLRSLREAKRRSSLIAISFSRLAFSVCHLLFVICGHVNRGILFWKQSLPRIKSWKVSHQRYRKVVVTEQIFFKFRDREKKPLGFAIGFPFFPVRG